jgi:hypothetical protein
VIEEGAAEPRTLLLFTEDRVEPVALNASIVRLRLYRRGHGVPAGCGDSPSSTGSGLSTLPPSRKRTRWDQVLFVLTAYRLLAPGSEWRLHRQ